MDWNLYTKVCLSFTSFLEWWPASPWPILTVTTHWRQSNWTLADAVVTLAWLGIDWFTLCGESRGEFSSGELSQPTSLSLPASSYFRGSTQQLYSAIAQCNDTVVTVRLFTTWWCNTMMHLMQLFTRCLCTTRSPSRRYNHPVAVIFSLFRPWIIHVNQQSTSPTCVGVQILQY